jgi:hypothetical protein
MGQVHEARTALERVRWLLRRMPDEAFADSPIQSARGEWQRFFDWAAKTPMLAEESSALPASVQ